MRGKFSTIIVSSIVLLGIGFAGQVLADELTRTVQEDLLALGYDPGIDDGEPSTATAIAIAKFEAEHEMEVTGEVTPDFADVLATAIEEQDDAELLSIQKQDPAMLQEAQQACLEEKMAESRDAAKKKRGFGRLLRAISRTASQTDAVAACQSPM